jgi:hypothetical protein
VPRAGKHLLLAVLATWANAAHAEAPRAVAGELHTLSVHVADAAAFDAVFDLFAEELRLPLLYGRRLGGTPPTRRSYASFRAGNVNLEVCGPYPDEFAEPAPRARFHGLTFRPAVSVDDAARALDEAGIERRPPFASGTADARVSFLVVSDPDVVGARLAVSLIEVADREAERERDAVASGSLAAAGGGPLGILRVREVELAHAGPVDKWSRVLAAGRAATLSPAVRLIEGEPSRVAAVSLEVRSLRAARARLVQRGLLDAEAGDGRLALRSRTAPGVALVFVEAPGASHASP